MRAFAALLDGLGYTQSRNRKIALLGRYFRDNADPDRGWALAALTDGVPVRLPLRRMLGELTSRFIDPVLYKLSRDYVGDTAETVALLWPDFPLSSFRRGEEPGEEQQQIGGLAVHRADLLSTPAWRGRRESVSLDDVIEAMQSGSVAERTQTLGQLLDALDASSRWALLKLIGGAPRVGVSARLARTALAESFGRDVAEIEEVWHGCRRHTRALRLARRQAPSVPIRAASRVQAGDARASDRGRRLAAAFAAGRRRGVEMGRHSRAACGQGRRGALVLARGRRHLGVVSRDRLGLLPTRMACSTANCSSCATARSRPSTICSSGSTARR